MPENETPTVLDKLRERRIEKLNAWAEVIKTRDTDRTAFEERSHSPEFAALSDEDRNGEIEAYRAAEDAFKSDSEQRESEIKGLDAEIERREELDRRLKEAAEASKGQVEVRAEPLTYNKHNARQGERSVSYWRDLALVHGPGITLQTGDSRDQAQARLIRHAQEMEVELPKRAKEREQRAQAQVAQAEQEFVHRQASVLQARGIRDRQVQRILDEMRGGLPYSPFERRVEPNMAQGQGGYFSPPLWLVDEFIPGLRAHLIVAGFPRQMDIPPGTSQVNIPKLSTLTVVGYQQLNNAGLPSQDWTDTSVSATWKTIGGYSDVAVQLLELSPHGIVDEVITTDLLAAHHKFLDAEVIAGDGTNSASLNGGHLKGIYPYTNWSANNVTYTDGSPAPWKFPSVVGCMASNIAETRFDASNFKVAVHGRRWFWHSTGTDANNRPLGETPSGGRFNIEAAINAGLQAEGLVGTLPSVADAPVYIDDNIPTTDNTDGGGATRDVAIAGLWDDAWLFQDPIRTDVFREVLSGSNGVRFRVYNYAGFLIRYGQSFAVATGSGFAPPTGAVSSLTF